MCLALVQVQFVGMQRNKKVVPQSTTEAKYISMSAFANQVIWLNKILTDLGKKQSSPMNFIVTTNQQLQLFKIQFKMGKQNTLT